MSMYEFVKNIYTNRWLSPAQPAETPPAPVQPTPALAQQSPIEPAKATPIEPAKATPIEPAKATPIVPAKPTPIVPVKPTPVVPPADRDPTPRPKKPSPIPAEPAKTDSYFKAPGTQRSNADNDSYFKPNSGKNKKKSSDEDDDEYFKANESSDKESTSEENDDYFQPESKSKRGSGSKQSRSSDSKEDYFAPPVSKGSGMQSAMKDAPKPQPVPAKIVEDEYFKPPSFKTLRLKPEPPKEQKKPFTAIEIGKPSNQPSPLNTTVFENDPSKELPRKEKSKKRRKRSQKSDSSKSSCDTCREVKNKGKRQWSLGCRICFWISIVSAILAILALGIIGGFCIHSAVTSPDGYPFKWLKPGSYK